MNNPLFLLKTISGVKTGRFLNKIRNSTLYSNTTEKYKLLSVFIIKRKLYYDPSVQDELQRWWGKKE
ncbi:MAG TPA: hypothetical protein DIS65_06255 [Candidatus Marinimicrobia bacterium]|nr:hypothetical protein [Candidatus Neomarinimicrobiota bacterium]